MPVATQFLPLNPTVSSFGAPRPDNSRPPVIPKRESHRSRSVNRNRGGGAGAGGGEGDRLLDRILDLTMEVDMVEEIKNL